MAFTFFAILTAHAVDLRYLPKEPGFAGPRACRAVDYRPELGPARVQGETSYCFAYSSANLVTQRTGVDVSAVDLATGFYFGAPRAFARLVNQNVRRELGAAYPAALARETVRPGVDVAGELTSFPNLEGGFEPSTLAWANARGLCQERRLPSEGGLDQYAGRLARFLREALSGRAKAGPEVNGVSSRFRGDVADRFNTAWLRFADRRCRRAPPPVDLLPVEFALAGTSREFRAARDAGGLKEKHQTRVLAALDFALDHGRVAAIGFDLNTVQTHASYVEEDGDHSVAIVGRRPAGDGECQYLVRDSAGDGCDAFDPAIRARCEGREYWLRESELRRSVYGVTYLR